MTSERFPLANQMLVEFFGPLKSARGEFRPHHVLALEGMIPDVWMMENEERRKWFRKLQAALNLLENSCNMHPQEIAEIVYKVADDIGVIQMEVFGLNKEIFTNEGTNEPDKRFRPILELYLTLYEKFYPLLVSPLIAGDSMLRTGVALTQVIKPNGRAEAGFIEKLERDRYPEGLLTEGLDRHIRNSISHRNYEIRSRDLIRMEDRNPKGKLTWGPQNYLYWELREIVLNFKSTCDALVATLLMFDVNNRDVLTERGFISLEPHKMRLDLAETYFRNFAEGMGFELVSLVENGFFTIEATVKILGWREDQPVEILVGGAIPRQFVEKVHTEDVSLREQVYGLIQQTLDTHDQYDYLIVRVLRKDDSLAGMIKANRNTRDVMFQGKQPIDAVQALLDEDTLPDETMPVIIREFPEEV